MWCMINGRATDLECRPSDRNRQIRGALVIVTNAGHAKISQLGAEIIARALEKDVAAVV